MDICISTGCPWDNLQPLLMKAGLMRQSRASLCQDLRVSCQDLMKSETRFANARVPVATSEATKASYYLCVGDPEIKNPQMQLQEKAKRRNLSSLLNPNTASRIINLCREVITRSLEA